MRGYTAVADPQADPSRGRPAESVLLSLELIESYLNTLNKNGCAAQTLKIYRSKLIQLYQYLPENNKHIRADTLALWRDALVEEGYAPSTVNGCTAAANGLMIYCGRREFQVEKPLKRENSIQPELTRREYLRLLSTARALEKEREYLLIKVLCSTGLTLNNLPRLTAQAVQDGKIRLPAAVLRIPDCLREELLDYIQREGCASGPVFVTRAGKPFERNSITSMIQRLCRDAQVPAEKANPRCLKKLYQTTRSGIHSNISVLVEQAHDRLLETEQLSIGWNQGR